MHVHMYTNPTFTVSYSINNDQNMYRFIINTGNTCHVYMVQLNLNFTDTLACITGVALVVSGTMYSL